MSAELTQAIDKLVGEVVSRESAFVEEFLVQHNVNASNVKEFTLVTHDKGTWKLFELRHREIGLVGTTALPKPRFVVDGEDVTL